MVVWEDGGSNPASYPIHCKNTLNRKPQETNIN